LIKGAALWPRLADAQPGAAAPIRPMESPVSDTPEWKPTAPAPEPAATSAGAPAAASPSPGPQDDRLSIDEFMKVELRVARILAAEAVPKSKKLLKLTVDAGTEQRTLVAGIAEAYAPDALVGRTVVIVANLKPAKLMGVESNGMVLAASADGGPPMLLAVDGEARPGTRVR
jgi:methionyl-tRNA synthetase